MIYDADLDDARSVLLESYFELEDGGLEFHIAVGRAARSPSPVADASDPVAVLLSRTTPIEVLPQSPRWRIQFPSYLAFSLRDESFAVFGQSCQFEGGFIRRYSDSAFLEYVAHGIANYAAEIVGPYVHWGFVCAHHVVDVASVEEPSISRRVV